MTTHKKNSTRRKKAKFVVSLRMEKVYVDGDTRTLKDPRGESSIEAVFTPEDFARNFSNEALTKLFDRGTHIRKHGPDKLQFEVTKWFKLGREVEALIASIGQARARHRVANESGKEYSTVEQYHKRYRRHLASLQNPEQS